MSNLLKLGIAIVLTIPFLIILFFPFFLKVKIDCKSQYGGCPSELVVKLKPLDFKSLHTAKVQVKKILNNDLLVSDSSVQFQLPNILLVNLIIKKPFGAIVSPSANKESLVDADGTVISVAEKSSLPTVQTDEDLKKEGEKISPKNFFALKLMAGIFQMYQVNLGVVKVDSLLVDLPPGLRVILPLEGDNEVLLGSLRLIYAKIQTGESRGKFSQIDLRFKDPVLR